MVKNDHDNPNYGYLLTVTSETQLPIAVTKCTCFANVLEKYGVNIALYVLYNLVYVLSVRCSKLRRIKYEFCSMVQTKIMECAVHNSYKHHSDL